MFGACGRRGSNVKNGCRTRVSCTIPQDQIRPRPYVPGQSFYSDLHPKKKWEIQREDGTRPHAQMHRPADSRYVVTGVSAAQLPGGNVYLGYTYLTSGSLSSGPLSTRHDLSNLNGFLVSGELKLLPWISGVAEYGANFGTERVSPFCEAITPCPVPFRGDTRMQTFLFGPRASLSIAGFRPFAHLLVGGAHLSQSLSVPVSGANFSGSETGFATAFGGGLDYKLIAGVAWRIQADDLRSDFFNSSHHNRFSTGILFRF
jgi:hypothetical protein